MVLGGLGSRRQSSGLPGVVTVVTSATPFATTQVMPFRRDQALLLPPDARERPPAGDVADVGGAAVEPVPLGSFGVRPIPCGTAQRQPRLPLARESGLLRLGAVAIDGTTGDADASRIRSLRNDRAKQPRATLAATILGMQHGSGLPKTVLADAGFASGEVVASLQARGIAPLVAIARTRPHRACDFPPPPAP